MQGPHGRGSLTVGATARASLYNSGLGVFSWALHNEYATPVRRHEKLTLRVEPLQPEQIKHIRESTRVSHAVFARLLNTSFSTVQKWEIGQKKPTCTALKLPRLVQKRALEVVA